MRISLIAAACVGAASLGGCERIPGTHANLIAKAEERAAEDLRDPLSAQFRRVKIVVQPAPADSKAAPDRFVCGEMNAKNAYGGYIGFAPFFVDLDRDVVHLDPQEEATFDQAREKIAACQSAARNPYAYEIARSYCDDAKELAVAAQRQADFDDLYAISCTVKEKPKASAPTKPPAPVPAPTPSKK